MACGESRRQDRVALEWNTPGLQPGVFQQPAHGLDLQTSVYLTESAFWVTFTALACILPPMS
jgi:hypothetical protein